MCFLLFCEKFDLNISANRIILSVVFADGDIFYATAVITFFAGSEVTDQVCLAWPHWWSKCAPFLHSKPGWWRFGSLYLLLVYCYCLHDLFIFINIRLTCNLCAHTPFFFLHFVLSSPPRMRWKRKNKEALIFQKLSSDVKWISRLHAPFLSMNPASKPDLSWAGLNNSDSVMDLNETLSALLSL